MLMLLMTCPGSVYGGEIVGSQGRYFIYMLPVAVLALPQPEWMHTSGGSALLSKKALDAGSKTMLISRLVACLTIAVSGLVA